MTVATWTDPDFETQSGTAYKTNLDNDLLVGKRITDRFAPHAKATPDMNILVDIGFVMVGITLTEKTQQTVGPFTAPVSNPRIDRVVIDRITGNAEIVAGAEAGSPSAPAIPGGKDPCCQIALATTTTTITNALIIDERVIGTGGAIRTLNKTPADSSTVGNTASETTVFTTQIDGGSLLTDNRIILNFRVKAKQHVANDQTLTLRVKYGSTTIAVVSGWDPGSTSYVNFVGTLVLMADNDAGQQIAHLYQSQNTAAAAPVYGSASEASGSNLNLVVTLQWGGTGGANQAALCEWANVVLES